MRKGFKIIFLLAVLINILFFNCQLPADEDGITTPVKPEIWSGIYDPDPISEPDRYINIKIYENNDISGSVGCSDFTMTFNGDGIINETSFNANGSGLITIPGTGTDSFSINLNGTISDSTMTGFMSIDFLTWTDESGTFNLTKI